MKTICLVMIVKNEAKVIKRCFDSLKDYIDYWVIHDTGSTDGTPAIIEDYFKQINKPGQLYHTEWKNFGYNRSQAVKSAAGKADYLLLMDADFVFHIKDPNFKSKLVADGYLVNYEGVLDYRQNLLVKATLDWQYFGVTHEYIHSDQAKIFHNMDGFTILHRADGGSRSDKYERDIQLLTKGMEDEPDNVRYMFYLAQSHRDFATLQKDSILQTTHYQKAIDWYQKRADAGGWDQEVYYSLYQIAECKRRMGLDFYQYLGDFMKAFFYRPIRLEALYTAVNTARLVAKQPILGYQLGKMALNNQYPNKDILFINKLVHDYVFLDELSVCAFHAGKFKQALQIVERILAEKKFPEKETTRLEQNHSVFRQKYEQYLAKFKNKTAEQIRQIKKQPRWILTIPPTRQENQKISLDELKKDTGAEQILMRNRYKRAHLIKDQPQILLLGNFVKFFLNQGISSNRVKFFQYLANAENNIQIHGYGLTYNKPEISLDYLIEQVYGANQRPDLIVYYLMSNCDHVTGSVVQGLAETNIAKVIWIEDIFYPQIFYNFIKQQRFNGVLLSYLQSDYYQTYKQMLPECWIGRMEPYIDLEVFKPLDEAKIYDILLYGYHDPTHYKFRDRVYKLLLAHQDRYKIKYIKHPGYNSIETIASNTQNTTNHKLALEINRAYLTICTSNDYQILVKKYIETPCANSIICGQLPPDYKSLKEKVFLVELDENMTDSQILATIDHALADRQNLITQAQANQAYFRSRYGYQTGLEKWTNLLNEFVSNFQPVERSISNNGLPFEQVFIISLPQRQERLKQMINRIKQTQISQYQVYPAIDGNLYQTEYQTLIETVNPNYIKSVGAYGLLKTYQKLIPKILASQVENVLLLEDDIYFHHNFDQLLADNHDYFKQYPVVYLGSNQISYSDAQLKLVTKYQKYQTSNQFWNITYGTFAICLRRDFLIKLNQRLTDLAHNPWPIDCLIWNLLREDNQQGLVLLPHLVIADVRDSDTSAPRDLIEFAKVRHWDLSLYKDLVLD